MRYPCFIFIFLSNSSLFGQAADDIKQVLELDRLLPRNGETLRYTNSVDSFFLDGIINSINNDRIINYKMNSTHEDYIYDAANNMIVVDSLLLTKDEKEDIINKILHQDNSSWIKTFFPNSMLIPDDTLSRIFSDPLKGWQYYTEKYGYGYYSFIKPVFIRNNTICIYYSGQLGCEICGHGSLQVYRKENGAWQLFSVLFSWIS